MTSRRQYAVVIEDDGSIVVPAGLREELSGLFDQADSVEETRASHVLPWEPVERAAFILLRAAFGDRGRMAAWTRQWNTMWQVDLTPVGGPVMETKFLTHEAGVKAELAWLEENYFGGFPVTDYECDGHNCPDRPHDHFPTL